MESFRLRQNLISLSTFFFVLLTFAAPVRAFLTPSDLSESTEEYALFREEKEILLQTPPPFQGGVLLWGPVTFLRERAKPKTEQVSFALDDATGPFVLRLTNGTSEGTRRVSSAVIKLNGQEIFRPSEFNQKVEELRRQVILLSGENLLEVNLRSAPGAIVTLELFRLEQQACMVYDFHTFRRSKGKPFKEVEVFELNPQFEGPYILNLNSGNSDGTQRVDSAVISLNNTSVFEPNDFNEQVGILTREVSLQSANTLRVELRGAPGDFLTIGITGYDDIPPGVTITNPKDGEIFAEGPITVRGTVDDPLASVTINGILVAVAADGSFTLDGVRVTDEETKIQAVAVDTCGNKDEDQISVFLRPAQEGPLLTFCIGGSLPTIAARAADCRTEAFTWGFGQVRGTTDGTTTELILDGISIPRGEWIEGKGNLDWGTWDGAYFSALLNVPGPDGVYPITATAKIATGGKTEATVTFIKDTKPPAVTITSPKDGWVTNNPIFTLTGTVDDPQATVYGGWDYSPIPIVDGVFAAEATLYEEGPNYVSISAFDPAWNGSEAVIWVTLDTTLPQVKIANLTDGMAVNNPILEINGTIIDKTPEAVTVAVNGGLSQNFSLSGENFSGVVNLVPGANTLDFTAIDKAGNKNRASRSIFLDIDPPIVGITSPVSEANVSGLIAVSVNAVDNLAGIAKVSLLVDGQLKAILTQPPFTFSLDTAILALGSHTITAVGMDQAGNQTEAAITVSVSRFRIEIVSPANGATINKSQALVQGKIHNQAGEIGVVVSGFLAEVNGEDFAVVIPLRLGQNILTATATNLEGLRAQTSLTVNTEIRQEIVRLTPSPLSGMLKKPANTLDITFEAEAFLENPVASYSWDFDGDGVPEATGIEPKITNPYQDPGFFFPKVTITDSQGNRYEETTLVHVIAREEVEPILSSKWEGVKTALVNGDIEGALQYFVAASRDRYRQTFTALGSERINYLFASIIEFKIFTLYGRVAGCGAVRIEGGRRYAYPVNFVQDENGIWKIMGL